VGGGGGGGGGFEMIWDRLSCFNNINLCGLNNFYTR
jgi:hypothetical protein